MWSTKYSYGIMYDDFSPICNYFIPDLRDAVGVLYNIIMDPNNVKNFEDKVKFVSYCTSIRLTVFNLKFDNGLILWNDDNDIRIASLYPEYVVLDLSLGKHLENVRSIGIPPIAPSSVQKNTNMEHKQVFSNQNIFESKIDANRHSKIFERASQVNTYKKENKAKKHHERPKIQITKEKSLMNNINNTIPALQTNNQKLKIFDSDKRSYIKIRQDLEKNNISSDDIHPCFVLKYHIFKILDGRKSIDFTSNNNIRQELELFQTLYDECDENSDDDENDKNNIPQKVYVPHNYNFMDDDKKEEYAKKYKMTRKQFENKYIKCMIQDDIIDNHINNINSPQSSQPEIVITSIEKNNVPENNTNTNTKPASDTSSNSEDGTESDSDSIDSDSIDTNFFELTKAYYEKRNLVV